MVWFTEDASGGWLDLELMLRREGIKLDGSQVPKAIVDVSPRLYDLVESVRLQGIDIPNPPSAPLAYTDLVEQLLHLGVLGRP